MLSVVAYHGKMLREVGRRRGMLGTRSRPRPHKENASFHCYWLLHMVVSYLTLEEHFFGRVEHGGQALRISSHRCSVCCPQNRASASSFLPVS